MEVIFYYNLSDSRVMNKTLITGETFEGVPVDEVDIMSPILRFEKEEILRYNYAYIPELQRYYSVSKRTIRFPSEKDLPTDLIARIALTGSLGLTR